MEAKKIRIKKNNNDLFETTRMYVNIICLTRGIKITPNESLILTHFISEGFTQHSKDKLVETKLIANKQCLSNIINKFRSLGLVVKEGHSESLHRDLDVTLARDLNVIELILTNK